MQRILTPAVALSALVLLSACSTPAPTPTPSVPAVTASPSASTAQPTTASPTTASPSATPTRTPSATASPSATAATGPRLTSSSCQLSVSEQSGDPLILYGYTVSAPSKQRWTITLTYTNDMGPSTETITGTGTKSDTVKLYGITKQGVTPGCKATIKAR
ncbi:hypothetical protein G7070_02065 [Propioniciclava coleopterorum]|uniref:Ig-like domain-containing protein n=1 Tax=Propioniciclava coleopterorum TaxID=2714937 RepID=A0A6G7Y382_9ACTN|nr:hypothetical protein [Propioniciclava coleopterorum]QIK71290.1 hypothetical protein G7070_02065 [Propioniciclava coleopterorum]